MPLQHNYFGFLLLAGFVAAAIVAAQDATGGKQWSPVAHEICILHISMSDMLEFVCNGFVMVVGVSRRGTFNSPRRAGHGFDTFMTF